MKKASSRKLFLFYRRSLPGVLESIFITRVGHIKRIVSKGGTVEGADGRGNSFHSECIAIQGPVTGVSPIGRAGDTCILVDIVAVGLKNKEIIQLTGIQRPDHFRFNSPVWFIAQAGQFIRT